MPVIYLSTSEESQTIQSTVCHVTACSLQMFFAFFFCSHPVLCHKLARLCSKTLFPQTGRSHHHCIKLAILSRIKRSGLALSDRSARQNHVVALTKGFCITTAFTGHTSNLPMPPKGPMALVKLPMAHSMLRAGMACANWMAHRGCFQKEKNFKPHRVMAFILTNRATCGWPRGAMACSITTTNSGDNTAQNRACAITTPNPFCN